MIAPVDMRALHRYLVARHRVDDYDNYIRLLAMFRNTAAIEANKAEDRRRQLNLAAAQVTVIRNTLADRTLAPENPRST